jgi:glycosyltransferase involved in cell wall biosynthesis
MIHLFINALAASAGGGLTYIRNVIPYLAKRDDVRTTVLLSGELQNDLPESGNVSFLQVDTSSRAASRFWFEQRAVPQFVERSGADVLVSAGNFAIWSSPVPQILLSRNSLYTSRDFISDLRARHEYRLLIDTLLKGALAKWSIHAADFTVAPSAAFALELQEWTRRRIVAIHHGFDRDAFLNDRSPLPVATEEKLHSKEDALRLLHVSHYNYYRNFETLIRAMPLIKQQLSRPVVLLLTCRLASGTNPGMYRPDAAAALIRGLGLSDDVVEVGSVPYRSLHHVYRAADVYVSAAYAESFAHPLVESMSVPLPVVASDLPVHREVCGSAALYFERFSPQQLAERVVEIAKSPQLAMQLSKAGVERSTLFSWKNHVERIVALAKVLIQIGLRPDIERTKLAL